MIVSETINSLSMVEQAEDLGRHYDRLAEYYDTMLRPLEWLRIASLRSWVCRNLNGKVLEAGIGSGLNLPFYSKDCEVFGVDVSQAMLDLAAIKAVSAAARVRLVKMDACRLDFPDGNFDACLATFLLCVLPEDSQLKAIQEMLRVTKPGGIVRLVDWQYPRNPAKRLVMKVGASLGRALFRGAADFNMKEAVALCGATVLWEGFMRGETMKVIDLVAPEQPKGGLKS